MRHSLSFALVVLRWLRHSSARAFLFLAAVILFTQIGNTSQAKISVTVTVDPVVQLIVSDGHANEIKGWGKSEAKLKIPLLDGVQTLTVSASAAGQKSDLGCTLVARIDQAKAKAVSINGKKLSGTEDTVLYDPIGYESLVKLSVATASGASGAGPAVLLSCRPK